MLAAVTLANAFFISLSITALLFIILYFIESTFTGFFEWEFEGDYDFLTAFCTWVLIISTAVVWSILSAKQALREDIAHKQAIIKVCTENQGKIYLDPPTLKPICLKGSHDRVVLPE